LLSSNGAGNIPQNLLFSTIAKSNNSKSVDQTDSFLSLSSFKLVYSGMYYAFLSRATLPRIYQHSDGEENYQYGTPETQIMQILISEVKILQGSSKMKTSQGYLQLQKGIKRFLDILISAIALFILSPILAAIAIAIKIDSPGTVIYSHRRIGKGGRPFHLYKFRSMVCGGDDKGYLEYLQQLIKSDLDNNGNGLPYRKWNGDSRVTKVGNFLRKFYMDELPQFWNVLKGEMSLVGPRPHVQLEVDYYTDEQKGRLAVKPGLTGLWQVIGKADCTFCELIQLDLDYINNWSIKLDIQLVYYTILLMLKGGEGFWARKVKGIPDKLPITHILPASNVYLFEDTENREKDWTLIK
jgi:lipopolysaccharide/colanic/teichoic acid biosynthesis glycosyltransferase